jgi:hypothetical protein
MCISKSIDAKTHVTDLHLLNKWHEENFSVRETNNILRLITYDQAVNTSFRR